MSAMPTAYVRAHVTEWVSDEPFPGVVRVELRDGAGRTWAFVDKTAMFEEGTLLRRDSSYPIEIRLACTLIERRGSDWVLISTAEPWGLEATDGSSRFLMKSEQVEGDAGGG